MTFVGKQNELIKQYKASLAELGYYICMSFVGNDSYAYSLINNYNSKIIKQFKSKYNIGDMTIAFEGYKNEAYKAHKHLYEYAVLINSPNHKKSNNHNKML